MREQWSADAEGIGELLARIPWAAHPRAWAALLLPLVPWTVAAAVGVPWSVARYGRIVDSEPWLHAPVTELVPPVLLWSGATALVASFALG
ncbi:hypothetical protein [Nocardiopsis sp. CC223A]|uniref:hypothetical protein n=1 Tax=Nocardiopsis sp. CC223A TaxID=3044051 RepID=UPI00278C6753|nr:hypothetical protein [Nocardiopsis sp. CC223A]